jgi:DNA-binding CsgD family transcriptional regulator
MKQSDDRKHILSPREGDVLALMARGFTNKEVARVLVVAEDTIKGHVTQILSKLDATNRTQAVAIWRTMPDGRDAEDLAAGLIDRVLATTGRPRDFYWLRAK